MHGPGHVDLDWKAVASAVPGAVAVQHDGTLVSVAEALAARIGVEPAALTGREWRALFAPGTADRLARTAVETALDGDRWTGTGTLAGDGGDAELTASPAGDDVVVWTVAEADDASTEPEARYRRLIEAAPVPIWVQREETLVYLNDAAADFFGADDPGEVVGRSDLEFVVPEERDRSLERNRRILRRDEALPVMEGRKVGLDGEVRHGLFAGAPIRFQGGEAILVIARDITERKRQREQLERQRDELATLDRINELLLETARELVQSSGRDAVERTVCQRLAESAFYQFAWVGERDPASGGVVPRVTAGEDDGYLDAVTITVDDSATGQGPVGRAMRTGKMAVANVDDPAFDPWREAARERDFESVAAVPLHHDGTVYGVLVVYATREDGFTDREQAGFGVLGRTVGFVIHAARSRDLLFADAVVELEFHVAGGADGFEAVAIDLGCELGLDGYVAADERWMLYLTVDGTDAGAAADALADVDRVASARPLGDGRVELVVTESPLLETVTAAGATVRSATGDADGLRMVAEAPAGADVRAIADRIAAVYPGTELLARRRRDREITTVGRADGPLDALTERQREVLEAAYRAGYFDWPRESTAEEVADALGVASPTLHNHLRRAEAKILTALLDD